MSLQINRRIRILAISGSTRASSVNLSLIKAIATLFANKADVEIFKGLSAIPHFNPDIDKYSSSESVLNFRHQLSTADGILICSPEYALGVPGTLKNAIDWTVASMEFSHKPVALITASTDGKKAHQSLLDTLKIIGSNIGEGCQLLISYASTKIKYDVIIDKQTLQDVKETLEAFFQCIEKNKVESQSN